MPPFRYQNAEFREEVTETLKKLTITSQNLMFTATTAKNYAIFEDVSNMLIQKCGVFLKTKLPTSEDVFNFLLTSHSTFPDGKTELLMELLRANGKCSNCKSSPCLVGQDISPKEHSSLFWNGMVIAKKEQHADDESGFACDVTNQQVEEMPGLAVMFNMQPVSRGRERSAVSLRCITHQAPIQGG